MLNLPVYLDNHSTTKADPRVFDEMQPYFTELYGNAASKTHEFGWKAGNAVEFAREKIARLAGAELKEIIFTSGATESINLALKGAAETYGMGGGHIITTAAEHKAGLDTCKSLEKKGYDVTYLKVDKFGLIDLDELSDSIKENTFLVSVMYANNEIGTINPASEIGKICKGRNVLFHTDASQAAGKIPVNVIQDNIDLMSFTAHKMYGPKGVGALYVRSRNPRVKLAQQIDGGGHERGFRSGTLNVPAIAGFGKACEIAMDDMETESKRISALRDRLYEGIISQLDEVYLNGHPEKRLPNNLNLSFAFADAESLMASMKEIAVSSGSACSSASVEPSHVLKAIGVNEELLHCSIRFGLGRFNIDEEIDYTIDKVAEKVKYLREISPAFQLYKKGLFVT
jgi:cysteine desulfurase